MNSAKGCLYAIVIVIVLFLVSFKFLNKHIFGNKQWIDVNQTFNTAYIDIPGKKEPVKIKISSWNDYDKSDSIQIISVDGTVHYTHLSRTVLCRE